MRKYLFLFIWLACLPMATRSQTLEDPDFTALLQPVAVQGYQYWFDEDSGNIQIAAGLSGMYTPDVSALADGLHVIHYVVIGSDGKAYSTSAGTFIKMEEMLNDPIGLGVVGAKGVTYWFDDDAANKKTTTDLSGVYSLDVTALEDGLHVLHYHIIGEDNLPYGVTSTLFLKNEDQFAVHEPARITKYTYWLNGDNSTVKTVTLDQPVTSYTLMSLLPLKRMPIRSSMFHFQVDDGVPTIYAKNTFNIRFYDSQGYFTDNFTENERTFIDYAVSQQVTGAELLESGVTATTSRPADNAIKWYYVMAEPGDSLEFKIDRPATIQLFSPSGEEVYHASGAESVKWGGCHAWESGIYYFALHDVTATSTSTINLDYNHIDKYAILRQNVKVVGNGGYTTITFEGNGFRDLYSIDMFDAEQNSIECVSLGIQSNALVAPTFDFTAVKLGVYDALFHFTEGNVMLKNAITVVEATDITIDTELETPSRFVGAGRPYSEILIVCPNGGNNTAYDVPVEVTLTAPKGTISYIDIVNPEIPTLADLLQDEELSDDEKEHIQQISDEVGDTYDFITTEWVDENTGAEMESKSIYLSTTIAPESSNTIKLNVASSTEVKTVVDCPPDWMPIYMIEKRPPPVQRPKICGGMEKIQCVLGKLGTFTGYVSALGSFLPPPFSTATGVVDCATSVSSTAFGFITESLCSSHPRQTFQPNSLLKPQKGLGLWSPIISCTLAIIPGAKLGEKFAKAITGGSATFVQQGSVNEQCESSFGNKLEGQSRLLYSKDPNAIYGYLSPSGSKYINEDQKDLNYTIEFENDSEVATAPAHDIYLTDELDASKFDLSTYKPTQIRIGDKTADLSGEPNFVTTVDMRPEIYAIAQVEGTYDEATGVARWHISSLDPMTMEPTEDIFNGVLPVNTDGQGVGQASFDIRLRDGLSHGTEISNKASIVFDANEAIVTPIWTNIIDAVSPTSKVESVTTLGDGMAEVSVTATDDLSGPWHYDVYVQYGTGSAWMKMAEGVPVGTKAKVKVYGGIDHGFCSVVTDLAGNGEVKEPMREYSLAIPIIPGDANGDGNVTITDAVAIVNYILGNPSGNFNKTAADVSGDGNITITDAVGVVNIILNSGASAPALETPNSESQETMMPE